MDISLQLNNTIFRKVDLFPYTRLLNKNLKMNTISCQAKRMGMHATTSDLYQVLSLGSENVGSDEIKKAYRRLALRYHPDLSPPSRKEESTRKFVEIQKAYETLSDPASREMYDLQLSCSGLMDIQDWKVSRKEGREKFAKGIWENQLLELEKRSTERMRRKSENGMNC